MSRDTIMVRSREEVAGWQEAEVYFWKEDTCFPPRRRRCKN